MHKHCTKKKSTYPNGTFETDIIKWHTSSLIHWDDSVNSTSYLSNSLFEKLDMFFFLTYTKNKSLGFFFSKSTHNTKSFLNANCNDDSLDRRRELEEWEILFHFFVLIHVHHNWDFETAMIGLYCSEFALWTAEGGQWGSWIGQVWSLFLT